MKLKYTPSEALLNEYLNKIRPWPNTHVSISGTKDILDYMNDAYLELCGAFGISYDKNASTPEEAGLLAARIRERIVSGDTEALKALTDDKNSIFDHWTACKTLADKPTRLLPSGYIYRIRLKINDEARRYIMSRYTLTLTKPDKTQDIPDQYRNPDNMRCSPWLMNFATQDLAGLFKGYVVCRPEHGECFAPFIIRRNHADGDEAVNRGFLLFRDNGTSQSRSSMAICCQTPFNDGPEDSPLACFIDLYLHKLSMESLRMTDHSEKYGKQDHLKIRLSR